MIKDILNRLFSRIPTTASTEWRTNDSLFRFVSSNIDIDGKLKSTAHDLPDEKRIEGQLRFAPGLTDALFGAEDSAEAAARVNVLTKLLKNIALKGEVASDHAFYQQITASDSVIGIIDAFLERITSEELPIHPHLYKFAHDLATRSPHRNGVKFGIALLGLCQNKTVLDELKILALHDEFTIFSAIAISALSDNPAKDLWQLARKVDGWGKIQLVSRLVNFELDDEIRDWLIRDGFRNSIMYEYLAYTCATHGLLYERLQNEKIDRRLFKSAGEIISALIMGGPAEDISQYVYAPAVVDDYIRHAKEHMSDLSDFLVLHTIKEYISKLQDDHSDEKNKSWTEDIISNCLIEIVALLNSRDWKQPTLDALKSDDTQTYWNAKLAAEKLGIDLWDAVWVRLLKNPLKSTEWYDVTHYATPDKTDQIIDFAVAHLPLKKLSTGPKDLSGLGPEFDLFQSLDSLITFLENFPKKGEPLVLAGLRSPVTRNRNMSLKTLSRWGEEHWSDAIRVALRNLKDVEPNPDTKANIERLLNGKELDWSVNV